MPIMIADAVTRKEFGNMLLSQRHWLKKSQHEMAYIVGIDQSTWSSWERGLTFPTSIDRLAAVLDKIEFKDADIYKLYNLGNPMFRQTLMLIPRISSVLRNHGVSCQTVPEETPEQEDHGRYPWAASENSSVKIKSVLLEGEIGNYRMNKDSGVVELVPINGKCTLVTGVLDKDAIDQFVRELLTIKEMMQ